MRSSYYCLFFAGCLLVCVLNRLLVFLLLAVFFEEVRLLLSMANRFVVAVTLCVTVMHGGRRRLLGCLLRGLMQMCNMLLDMLLRGFIYASLGLGFGLLIVRVAAGVLFAFSSSGWWACVEGCCLLFVRVAEFSFLSGAFHGIFCSLFHRAHAGVMGVLVIHLVHFRSISLKKPTVLIAGCLGVRYIPPPIIVSSPFHVTYARSGWHMVSFHL